MAINSRAKGARGELEWAQELRERFGCANAHRGRQYQGSPASPDCADGIPSTHVEVKRVERLNIDAAVAQAVRDAGDGNIPYVAHRRNRKPWLVTVRGRDLVAFAKLVLEAYGGEQ